MVNGSAFLVASGRPGSTPQTRKSNGSMPSSLRSTPKTSTARPNSKTATGSSTMTLTLRRLMVVAYWQ